MSVHCQAGFVSQGAFTGQEVRGYEFVNMKIRNERSTARPLLRISLHFKPKRCSCYKPEEYQERDRLRLQSFTIVGVVGDA